MVNNIWRHRISKNYKALIKTMTMQKKFSKLDITVHGFSLTILLKYKV